MTADRHVEAHAAVLGELEGVREQVLEHLLQALLIGEERAPELRVELHVEGELARFGVVAEGSRHRLEQRRERELRRLDGDRARLDLRQVEDVGDQIQQIRAGAVNRARELDLLRGQVLFRVLAQLLAQDQNAVQRRPQLVRHVRQELGLVLRGERKLLRLVLERAARLLDLLVLALDLGVLLGELLGLLPELLVGLLQLLLLGLQLARELLRLIEQRLGLHRGFDAVEHDADAARELVEEGQVRLGVRIQRGELDHGLDLAFGQHRQHDHVARQRR